MHTLLGGPRFDAKGEGIYYIHIMCRFEVRRVGSAIQMLTWILFGKGCFTEQHTIG